MRNPLLVFFSGYNINRYYIKLKLPRDFSITKRLEKDLTFRSGTCPWRGLYARWNLISQFHTLLDFSQLKQYRLGFDSTLPKYKSTQKLIEYRNIRFNLTYTKIMKDHIFYNFFFNHGTYSTTSNHNILLWYPVFKQILSLNRILHRKQKLALHPQDKAGWEFSWKSHWPQDALVWSMLASQKFKAVSCGGFLTDTLAEEYEDFFYVLSAWEHTTLSASPCDDYLIDSEADLYVLPEFLGFREIAISHASDSTGAGVELAYSTFNFVKLLEDFFFKKTTDIVYKDINLQFRDTYFSVLMHLYLE